MLPSKNTQRNDCHVVTRKNGYILDPLSPQSRNKLLFFNKVFRFFCALAAAFGGRLEVGMSLVRNSGWCASIHTGERLKSAVLADFSKRLAENSASTAENGGGGAEVSIICPNCCLGRFFFFSLQTGIK